MKNTLRIVILFLFFTSQNLFAQEVYTEFTNPSFEDLPRPQHPPFGWWNCGFPGETPPDVHPVPKTDIFKNGAFGVTKAAYDGNTYLGMVVRENNTWESLGQRLETSLQPNLDYTFSIFLSKSETYLSRIRGRNEEVSFTEPVLLRVWGGSGFCQNIELLAESELVDHTDWKKYTFKFSPKLGHTYILLEAYYDDNYTAPNGNIMLDNLSPIYLDNDYVPTLLDSLKRFVNSNEFRILFNNENELLEESKILLIELVKKMEVVDNIHLAFCIRVSKESKRLARIKKLQSFFIDLELDKRKYTVKEFGNYLERFEWISDTSDFVIGLIELE